MLLLDLVAKVRADVDGAQKDLSNLHKSLGDNIHTAAGKGGSAIASLGGNVLDLGMKLGGSIFAVKSLADGAMGLGSALLGPVASMEQNKIAFTGLLGSGQKAQAFLQDMQQFAAATPFEFPELVTASQHMLAFGFSAKDIKPMLSSIGDAMAAMGQGGDSVDQVVRILGQMHAATKVNAGDMMQLTSMGIPAWDMLAKGMGKTVPQLQDMVSRGLVPADKAIGILEGSFNKSFGGSMQKQSETFNGLLSTFHDNINLAIMAFAGPAFDRAKQALTQLGNAVQSPAFQQFAQTVGVLVGQALDVLANALGAIVPQVMNFARFLQQNEGAMNAFKGVLIVAAAVIGVVLVASFVAWAIAAGAAAIATIAATWPILLVIAAIALLVIGIKLLVEHWSQITQYIQVIWNAAVKTALDLILQLGRWFSDLGTAIHDGLMNAAIAIAQWTMGLITRFLEAHQQAVRIIGNLVSGVVNWFAELPGRVFGFIANLVSGVVSWFVTMELRGISIVVGFIGDMLGRFWSAVGQANAAMGSVASAVLGALSGLGGRLAQLARDAIGNMISAIRGMAGAVGSAVSGLLGGLHLPHFAGGGTMPGSGFAMVGEEGPELVALPAGATVYPHGTAPTAVSAPRSLSSGGGGSDESRVIQLILDDGGLRVIAEAVLPHQVRELRRLGVNI